MSSKHNNESIGDVTTLSSVEKPIDQWNMVKTIFILHGIAALLPWNMLINADSYFVDYKLSPNQTTMIDCMKVEWNQSVWCNQTSFETNRTRVTITLAHSPSLVNYRKNFLPYLSTASKLPNIIFQLVNLLFSSRYKASSNRLIFSYIIEIVLFIIIIVLALIDTSSWPEIFFWVTIIIAILFNTVNGIFQSSIYGIGAKFPIQYINNITLGFSFSGIISAIFLIISLLLSPEPKVAALYYFSFAIIFMVICVFNEFIVRKNNYLKYNIHLSENDVQLELPMQSKIVSYQNPFSVSENDLVNHTQLNSEHDKNGFGAIVVHEVQEILFPAVQAGIRPLNSLIDDKFFAPVFCFLFFNLFQTIGNYVAERTMIPNRNQLIIWVLCRSVFIPFFLFCNYLPDKRVWPIFINHDLIYIIGSALMAFTSGYLSALGIMYAPQNLSNKKQASTAAMMASAAVIIGILFGVQFSIVLRHMVTTLT
ncbi:hypothetical protein RDWZM_000848 [Blomia tropicalis]|uniref:Equilibrative nucleoside transporter 1 n=1 Tax=Blomia tropicalis TaxID=40697 RepID=A0A9Q0M9N6_BLOTA|nr:hypothetical protein RDWZM_000848 [Blomia tropicalis]